MQWSDQTQDQNTGCFVLLMPALHWLVHDMLPATLIAKGAHSSCVQAPPALPCDAPAVNALQDALVQAQDGQLPPAAKLLAHPHTRDVAKDILWWCVLVSQLLVGLHVRLVLFLRSASNVIAMTTSGRVKLMHTAARCGAGA